MRKHKSVKCIHATLDLGNLSNLKVYKHVSFDFFDTLFYRSSVTHHRGWKQISTSFAINRFFAELIARSVAKIKGRGEIRFHDIYRYMFKKWTPDLEIENEFMLLRPNIILREIFNDLLTQGVSVSVISDTHFEAKHLAKWLALHNFQSVPIYTSQEFMLTKTTGLFKHLKSELLIDSNSWLHLGDNLTADVISAKNEGISALHYPKITQQLQDHGILSEKAIHYLMRRGNQGIQLLDSIRLNFLLCPSTLLGKESNTIQEVGAIIVGPLAETIARAVHSQSLESGSELILYSSRDGWLPFRFHKKLFSSENVQYFRTSRALSSDPLYGDYVARVISTSQRVSIYDLGWRGSTISKLREIFPSVQWFGQFGYLRNGKLRQVSEVFENSRFEKATIWRSRDFVEILFPDGSPGYNALSDELVPVERSTNSRSKAGSLILQGFELFLDSDFSSLTPRQAGLLLHVTCRFPSKSLRVALSDEYHDIREGQFSPLITNSWKVVLSGSRVMWPYASGLDKNATIFERAVFKLLVFQKETIQRSKNLFGRITR